MDLFDKAKLRLDSHATPAGARDLCLLGVLPAKRYLRALFLMRDSGSWNLLFKRTLLVLGCCYLVMAVFLAFYQHWDGMSFTSRMVLLQALLAVTVVLGWISGVDSVLGKTFLIASIINVGFITLMVGRRYPMAVDSWSFFAGWSLLILPWVLCSRSALIWILGLVIANYSAMLWAYQVGIPNNIMGWQTFLMVQSLANLAVLMAIEVLSDLFFKRRKSYLWATSLAFTMSIALFLACYNVYTGLYATFEVWFMMALTCFLWWFYYKVYPRYHAMLAVTAFFVLFLLASLLEMTVGMFDAYAKTLTWFLALTSLFYALELFAVIGLFSWFAMYLNNRRSRGLMS